ncbi:hypothetical protein [Kutzneria chonburiensis]|nr:hypothetical protein [Kutzneria chonburiensis]
MPALMAVAIAAALAAAPAGAPPDHATRPYQQSLEGGRVAAHFRSR